VRGALTILLQLVAATLGLAAIGGLLGFLVVHFTGWGGGGAAEGFGWGMIICGAVVGFAAGGSGSPSENLARGRSGAFGTYWGQSAPLPQSPLQLALGGLFAFGAGVAVLILFAY
jgi:hypothetical protein